MLKNDDFEMHYQPQYSLKEDKIIGFEALFRVKKRVELNAGAFEIITYAERSGNMVLLGDFIFDTSMKFAKTVENMGVTVSLNVSPVQLMQAGFVDRFLQIYRKYDIKPGVICVEVTESFLMTTFEETVQKLEILKKNGILVHLDDFGTDYSSLLYLKKLPIDTIKVDKEFVTDICENEYSKAITKLVINIAHELKLTSICEGIETYEQLEIVRSYDCDVIQGFIVGKAMEADVAREMITTFKLEKKDVA
jgi:EAL domain-containing protein (putative c-di-GMP-specific phosphodiesterase class I)